MIIFFLKVFYKNILTHAFALGKRVLRFIFCISSSIFRIICFVSCILHPGPRLKGREPRGLKRLFINYIFYRIYRLFWDVAKELSF